MAASASALLAFSISGFGEQGPYAHKRVYDPVIQALSGAADIQANRETGKPGMFRIIIADKVTSLTAAQAISAALFARERTGKGDDTRWLKGFGSGFFTGFNRNKMAP